MDDISTKHPEYTTEFSHKCNDVYNGDVKDYIPKLSGQSNEEYEAYQERASLYNVTNRSVAALVGAMTRKKYQLTGMDEPKIVDGMSMEEFVTILLKDLLLTGRIGIFVDYDDELKSPYLIPYQNKDITNWSDEFIVIEEFYYKQDPTNMYNQIVAPRYRELYLDEENKFAVRLWEKVGEMFVPIDTPMPLVRQNRLDHIPFVFATPFDTSMDIVKPTLNNLADINLSHFKLSTDLMHALHFTALPQPYITGDLASETETLSIGTSDVWQLEIGATVNYLEFSGSGITQIQSTLKELEMQMAAIGSRLLEAKSGVESAEALRIRNGSESASLISLVGAVESAITQALNHYVHWTGLNTSFEFSLNKDFSAATMSPQDISTLMALLEANLITDESFYSRLEKGEIVDENELSKLSNTQMQ